MNQNAPDDLVLMPDDRLLDITERRAVEAARWWEADGKVLLVSSGELAKAGVNAEDDPAGGGVNLATCEIVPVADHLKHWSPTDGFWHA